jgi:hypothetical protein
VFYRIWGTNWWRNANAELRKIVEFIEKVQSENLKEQKYNKNLQHSAIGSTTIITDTSRQIDFFSTVEEDEITSNILQSSQNNQNVHPTPSEKVVTLNSKVRIKYLNSATNLVVHIVKTTKNYEIIDGVQKVPVGRPLSTALMGRSVGDIVRIGNLDRFAEILEIL